MTQVAQAQDKILQYRRQHNAPIYYKSMAQQASINEASRTIEFYFAVWGKKDINGEISMKGCMSKSIQEHGPGSKSPQKIICLYQHDQCCPVGLPTSLIEDDFGAKAIVTLDNIPLCDQIIEQLKSGTLNQFSYGFKYVWDRVEWDETNDALVLKEVQLFEISIVSIGASPDTQFLGFKSINDNDQIEELLTETESFIKGLDSTKQLQARSIIYKHIALSKREPPPMAPPKTTPPAVNIKEAINNFKF